MTNMPHMIKTLELEIKYQDCERNTVNLIHNYLYNILKDNIENVLLKIFNKIDDGRRVIKINRLSLDLGIIKRKNNIEDTFKYIQTLLEKKLYTEMLKHRHLTENTWSISNRMYNRDFFKESVFSTVNRHSINPDNSPNSELLLYITEIFIFFLEKGRYPWWYNEAYLKTRFGETRRISFSKITSYIFENDPDILFRILDYHTQNPIQLDRIIHQLPYDILCNFIRTSKTIPEEYKKDIFILSGTLRKVKGDLLNKYVDNYYWKALILTCNLGTTITNDRDSFFETVLLYLSKESGIKYDDLINALKKNNSHNKFLSKIVSLLEKDRISNGRRIEKKLLHNIYNSILDSIMDKITDIVKDETNTKHVKHKSGYTDFREVVISTLSPWINDYFKLNGIMNKLKNKQECLMSKILIEKERTIYNSNLEKEHIDIIKSKIHKEVCHIIDSISPQRYLGLYITDEKGLLKDAIKVMSLAFQELKKIRENDNTRDIKRNNKKTVERGKEKYKLIYKGLNEIDYYEEEQNKKRDVSILSNRDLFSIADERDASLFPLERRNEFGEGRKGHHNDTDEIYVENAGLVIVLPFLKNLFEKLVLIENGMFIDKDKRKEAMRIIHYLVTGSDTNDESEMTLIKIICNYDLNITIEKNLVLKKETMKECKILLENIIYHWEALKKISVEGLRNTFLKRKGSVRKRNGAWLIHVEKDTVDVLLNRLPWSISVIKLPWLKEIIYVEW